MKAGSGDYIKSLKMETPTQNLESLFANAGEYIETKAELWKLKMVDKTSEAVSSIAEKLILFFLGFFFFIFLNIALALLIGYWLGHSFYGFFIMAAFYAIVGLLIHSLKDKLIKTPVANSIIEKFIK
jgi:hypothetical protein